MDMELLEAIGKLMDEKLDEKLRPIIARLDSIEGSAEITRDAMNKVLEWTDELSQAQDFPLPRVQ